MNRLQQVGSTVKSLTQRLWNEMVMPAVKCAWHDHRIGRMMQWGLFSLFLYGLVICKVWPLILQAALTKGANVNAGAFLGYWIDRTLFIGFDYRFDADPNSISDVAKAARVVSRAIVVAASVIGLSMGIGA